jgi:hypothetical protein
MDEIPYEMLDPLVLALAVDALPPTVFGLGRLGWAPTIELTFLVRGLPAYGWLSVHVRGRLVQDGWFDEEAEMYDSAGRLVAQSVSSRRSGSNRRRPRLRRRPRIAADRRT